MVEKAVYICQYEASLKTQLSSASGCLGNELVGGATVDNSSMILKGFERAWETSLWSGDSSRGNKEGRNLSLINCHFCCTSEKYVKHITFNNYWLQIDFFLGPSTSKNEGHVLSSMGITGHLPDGPEINLLPVWLRSNWASWGPLLGLERGQSTCPLDESSRNATGGFATPKVLLFAYFYFRRILGKETGGIR